MENILNLFLSCRNSNDKLLLMGNCRKLENPVIITSDFDDTLADKTGVFAIRNKIFSILSNAENVLFFIVTSRKNIISEEDNKLLTDNMLEFCEYYDIRIDGIFYNIRNKINLLKILNPVCHFDDHLKTVFNCVNSNIPSMIPTESLEEKYHIKWVETLENTGEIRYYNTDVIKQKEILASTITNLCI